VTSIEKNENCLKIALYPDRFRDYYRPGFLVSTGLISRSGHQFISSFDRSRELLSKRPVLR